MYCVLLLLAVIEGSRLEVQDLPGLGIHDNARHLKITLMSSITDFKVDVLFYSEPLIAIHRKNIDIDGTEKLKQTDCAFAAESYNYPDIYVQIFIKCSQQLQEQSKIYV